MVATHDVEFASVFAERVVLLGHGELIADGPVAEILSGGWYFATEVARILGAAGAISPERARLRGDGRARTKSGRSRCLPRQLSPSPPAAQPKTSCRRSGS